MSSFCKNGDCPASAELLAFQNGDLPVSDGARIRKHLLVCEFCAAEVDFYSHYPPAEVQVENVNIPQPLKELAEALFSTHQKKSNLLDAMIE